MIKTYFQFWTHLFDTKHRSSRRDVWIPTIINTILLIIILFIIGNAGGYKGMSFDAIMSDYFVGIWLLWVVLSWGLQARRLHDLGLGSAWLIVLAWVLPLMWVVDLVAGFPYENQWGYIDEKRNTAIHTATEDYKQKNGIA